MDAHGDGAVLSLPQPRLPCSVRVQLPYREEAGNIYVQPNVPWRMREVPLGCEAQGVGEGRGGGVGRYTVAGIRWMRPNPLNEQSS